jgi:hypothetical protein
MLEVGLPATGVPLCAMSLHDVRIWEIAAGATVVAGITGLVVWAYRRKRPTPQEIELARRTFLTQSGRLVDGTLLDIAELPAPEEGAEPGRTLTMLIYEYRIGGVDYECSQDITDITAIIPPEKVRAGFPCSVRYQPGSPQNSIVVAERWSGLRANIPAMYDERGGFHHRILRSHPDSRRG